MSRINNDVSQVQQVVSETVGDLARESLALVGYAALLFYYDARLAIVCLTERAAHRVSAGAAGAARAADDAPQPGGARADLAHQRRSVHRPPHRQGVRHRGAGGASNSPRGVRSLFRTNMKVTQRALGAAAAHGAARRLRHGRRALVRQPRRSPPGRLTTGEFTSFIAALFLMYGPAKKLSRVNANLQQAIAASERIFEMLDTHTEVKEQPGAQPLAPFRERDRVPRRQRSVRRPRPRRILRDVSFTVHAGQMVAIVGRSGAGKTTLVNLLPRFYDVTAGSILIDGVDIRDVTLASLRGQIGIVTQETVLFDDTIANNIAYGAPHGDARPRSRPRRAPRTRTSSSRRCRRATRR